MPRILISVSAVNELRALEPAALRRRVVAGLSSVDLPAPAHRICSAERYRLLIAGRRVLYGRRSDGTVVIVGVAGRDAVDSQRVGSAGM